MLFELENMGEPSELADDFASPVRVDVRIRFPLPLWTSSETCNVTEGTWEILVPNAATPFMLLFLP